MKKVLCMILCLMLAMGSAMAAETVKFGDLFEVANCREYITLRAEASTKAEALDRLALGEPVRYLGSDGHGFARVLTMDGAAGYVLEEYLARMQTTAIAYADVDVSDEEYYNVNLFLTNFTEQFFEGPAGYFDAAAATDGDLVQFAIEHIWFNRQDYLEWGDWGKGAYNVRLSDKYVAPVCEKYFGRAPENLWPLYADYSGGYYYWQETGGHVPGGFAQASEIYRVGPDAYRVIFSVYGQGMAWDESVYGMGERKLANEHPEYFSKYQPRGSAVFSVGEGGSLADRSGWKLRNLCMDWEEFSGTAAREEWARLVYSDPISKVTVSQMVKDPAVVGELRQMILEAEPSVQGQCPYYGQLTIRTGDGKEYAFTLATDGCPDIANEKGDVRSMSRADSKRIWEIFDEVYAVMAESGWGIG